MIVVNFSTATSFLKRDLLESIANITLMSLCAVARIAFLGGSPSCFLLRKYSRKAFLLLTAQTQDYVRIWRRIRNYQRLSRELIHISRPDTNLLSIVRLKQPNRLKIHQKAMKDIRLIKEENWPRMTVVMQDSFHSTWKRKQKI